MDLHELQHKTVNDLREMAAKYDDVKGVTGLKKDQLLEILCDKLGIDRHVHVPKGIGRHDIRAHIRELRGKRDKAEEAHDAAALAEARREIKFNKRRLRRLISTAVKQDSQKPAAAPAAKEPAAAEAAPQPAPAEAAAAEAPPESAG